MVPKRSKIDVSHHAMLVNLLLRADIGLVYVRPQLEHDTIICSVRNREVLLEGSLIHRRGAGGGT